MWSRLQVVSDSVHRVLICQPTLGRVGDHAGERVLKDGAARASRASAAVDDLAAAGDGAVRGNAKLLGVAVPRPVDTRLGTVRVVDDLRKALTRLVLGDVGTDRLHEYRKEVAKPLPLLTEKIGLGDAAGIHRREDDARLVVESFVHLEYGHHVECLCILVCLSAVKLLRRRGSHRRRLRSSEPQPLELAELRHRLDQRSGDRVAVARDGADNAAPSALSTRQLRQQQLHQQEVPEMVDTEGHFEAIVSPTGRGVGRFVDGRVTYKVVDGPRRQEKL
mmetsp:Transcript_44708/g.89279  ORF Transcript_44708/g.89279 Transcript_44708/m.89279 type:complete len:277 (-) Transcript_44708:419-1249(-)